MIEIEVSASQAVLLRSEVLTAGRVGLGVRLHFDASWDGLLKVAVIEGSTSYDMLLKDDSFTVPGECLSKAGDTLRIGLYGISSDGLLAFQTLWVNCGEIQSGVRLTETPDGELPQTVLAQILSQTAEALALVEQLREDANNGRFTGPRGEAGFSPTISVTSRSAQGDDAGGWDLEITGADGTQTISLNNGKDAVSYLPALSEGGVLSWTNDGGADNPPAVDIATAVLQAIDDGDEVSY